MREREEKESVIMGDEVGAEPPSLIGDNDTGQVVVSSKMATSSRRRRLEPRRLQSEDCSTNKRAKSHYNESSGDSSSSPTAPAWSTGNADEGLTAAGANLGNGLPPPSHGAMSLIGRRREMEDAVTVAPRFAAATGEGLGVEVPSPAYDFFGVYDRHGGSRVAEACGERLHLVLAEEVAGGRAEGRWREAMVACFARMDRELAGKDEWSAEKTAGSTAVVGPRRIVVANCGDSRAVLSCGGVPVPLSSDHKPDRPDEMERVEAAGGRVIDWPMTSRSIGDYYSEPEVTITERTERDEFLILASHGLWDVVPNELACDIARQCLSGKMARAFPGAADGCTAGDAASMLVRLAISLGSKDNISVVVVEFRNRSRYHLAKRPTRNHNL